MFIFSKFYLNTRSRYVNEYTLIFYCWQTAFLMNNEPKSVNIDKISTALHVYYLNLIVNYLNTVQIAQIQAYNFECTPCSDAMNRVFDIKSGHDFCRYRNSIQVIYFQINGKITEKKHPTVNFDLWNSFPLSFGV